MPDVTFCDTFKPWKAVVVLEIHKNQGWHALFTSGSFLKGYWYWNAVNNHNPSGKIVLECTHLNWGLNSGIVCWLQKGSGCLDFAAENILKSLIVVNAASLKNKNPVICCR